MILPADKGRLANLVVSDTYRSMRIVAEELLAEWYKDIPVGSTQFEYLRNCLEREGKIQGIDHFLKRIEKLAQYD